MKRVAILQHRLLHYRTKLFMQLRERCSDLGIELSLVHGQASRREKPKNDEGSLPWAHRMNNWFFELPKRDLVWQPFPTELRSADLVVVMQENRLLSNYPLLLSRLWSDRKVAYWGHGVNFQSDSPGGFREKWKRLMLTRVDWWFGYTNLTRDILLHGNYPAERITVLNNAIDNEAFRADLDSITDAELLPLRAKVSRGGTAVVGLFCGSLYPDKRLDFTIEAADLIQAAIPEFSLVVIGDGPSADAVKAAAATRPWLIWAGVRKGREKAAYFRLADVILNPGAVGLHVLDSFCAGVPLVTTPDARHGPEIAYLENGKNGLIVPGQPQDYANAVVTLLRDEAALQAIKQAAGRDADQYSLDSMVTRFVEGIEACLSMPKKGAPTQ